MFKTKLKTLCAATMLALSGLAAPQMAHALDPLPIDNWAIRHAVSNVAISPDGKHMLVLKLESKDGTNVLEIYKTTDLSKPFRRLNAKPMEFTSASWASDNYIIGSSWRQNRTKVKGPEDGTYDRLFYAYDLKKNKFNQLENKQVRGEGGGFSLVNLLPKEPDTILIATGQANNGGTGVDPFALIRPRSYYRFNTKTGRKSLVLKGNEKYNGIQFDNEGNPRLAGRLDPDTKEAISYYRLPGEDSWTEYGERYDIDEPENMYRALGNFHGPIALHPTNPKLIYMIDNPDSDKAALWEYDLTTSKRVRKLYEPKDADVRGVQFSSNFWGGNFNLVAARYPGAKYERHWFDEEEKALYEQFEGNIPNAHAVSISSRSRDGQTMIVQNSGPKDPGSFWLVQNGKMGKLGSRNPLLKAEDLAEVKYIRYPARDGMMIPGYVTVPKGDGPHPLVVLPHGGPHVTEIIGFDEWGQLLANNGYMVLQPQYRMSVGWGQKHFDSAMGQHGLAMQDDKDDGAKYLVEQGWADPDRMAMFGWSYGGYAALVAASRSPNLYQCVVAGAAVADAKKVYLKRSGPGTPDAIDDWARARGGFVGINPIDEVDKVNVPVFMVHGDVDARVLYFNFKDYKKKMDAAGKTAEYMTLKGADHFSTTLMYNHQKDFYTKLIDFLENDCGPGGL